MKFEASRHWDAWIWQLYWRIYYNIQRISNL